MLYSTSRPPVFARCDAAARPKTPGLYIMPGGDGAAPAGMDSLLLGRSENLMRLIKRSWTVGLLALAALAMLLAAGGGAVAGPPGAALEPAGPGSAARPQIWVL